MTLRRAGMEFSHPRNWRLRRRDLPAAFELTSGEAAIAGWAYAREEDLPEPGAQLESARERLVEAIEERDPEFRVRSAEATEVAGAPAIDVRGDQVIAERRLRTRSVHVFEGEVEYVIEALSPPADFAARGPARPRPAAPLARARGRHPRGRGVIAGTARVRDRARRVRRRGAARRRGVRRRGDEHAAHVARAEGGLDAADAGAARAWGT